MDDENIVSVILRDTSGLQLGETYRFCLVLLNDRPNAKRDLVVGCSNQTRLQAFEDDGRGPDADATDDSARLQLQKYYDVQAADSAAEPVIATDYASNRTQQQQQQNQRSNIVGGGGQTILVNNHIGSGVVTVAAAAASDSASQQRAELLQQLNRSFLPGLAMGILITGALVLVLGIVRLRVQRLPLSMAAACGGVVPQQQQQQQRSAAAANGTTCYAASGVHIPGSPDADADGGVTLDLHNRYLKLQATTSL